jgi:hypothetical protein
MFSGDMKSGSLKKNAGSSAERCLFHHTMRIFDELSTYGTQECKELESEEECLVNLPYMPFNCFQVSSNMWCSVPIENEARQS